MRSRCEICVKLTIKTLETNRKYENINKFMYVHSTPQKHSNKGILGKAFLRYY